MGWGGILTFMYLAYIRGCYAAATSLGMGGVGGDINVHVPCLHRWVLRCCYVTGHGWGGGILTFMYLAYIRGCYAAATSLGMGGVGGDINVHVPCLHTWMLRCCYVTGHGWGEVAFPFKGALDYYLQHLWQANARRTTFLGCELLLVLSHAECA